MTVPLKAMNFDEDGNRVSEPVQYGTMVKVRYAGGDRGIHWDKAPMPLHMLVGLRQQLEDALNYVDAQLRSAGVLS